MLIECLPHNLIKLPSLRIQVCPKEGITAQFLFCSDGIGILNPTRSGGFCVPVIPGGWMATENPSDFESLMHVFLLTSPSNGKNLIKGKPSKLLKIRLHFQTGARR